MEKIKGKSQNFSIVKSIISICFATKLKKYATGVVKINFNTSIQSIFNEKMRKLKLMG